MAVVRNATYGQAVDLFVDANDDWLTDSETPLVTALFKAAEALDTRTTAALLGEFRQVMRELYRRKPGVPLAAKLDEFEEMMSDFS